MLLLDVDGKVLVIIAFAVGKEFVLALVPIEYVVSSVVPLPDVVAASVVVLILEVDVGMLIVIRVSLAKPSKK
jgi:hypothetical protein